MKKNFEIELPFFCGFYNTIFDASEMMYNEIQEDDYYKENFGSDNVDDYEVDYQEYEKDVCETYCNAFANYAPSFVESVKMKDLVSPKYYNYSTDKIYADVELADDWKEQVINFIKDNKEWLTERVKKDWTSYDGFWSFMSNDYNEWLAEFEGDEIDERYLACIISYMMYKENKEIREWLDMETYENVYLGEYIKYVG